jgi:hypothetical protein
MRKDFSPGLIKPPEFQQKMSVVDREIPVAYRDYGTVRAVTITVRTKPKRYGGYL